MARSFKLPTPDYAERVCGCSREGDPNPVEPQSDERKGREARGQEQRRRQVQGRSGKGQRQGRRQEGHRQEGRRQEEEETPVVTIDLDGIGQRIVALPIRAANYIGLNTGKAGILFLSEIVDVPRLSEPALGTVSKFDFSTRKTEPFVAGVSDFVVSANGEKARLKPRTGASLAVVHRRDGCGAKAW